MTQQIVVALVVLTAVAFTVWRLMPARRRLLALLAFDAFAARRPSLARWRRNSLAPRIARAAGSGCDGCAANVGIRPQQPPR